MWPFRRRNRQQYPQESVQSQLKIIRTHMAAQAGDLSTLRMQLARNNDQVALMLQRLDGPTK